MLAIEKQSPRSGSRRLEPSRTRDPRDVIGWLVTLIHKPYKYELLQENAGTPALLKVDGERFDLQRFYQPPPLDWRLVPVVNSALVIPQGSANIGRTGLPGFPGGMLTRAYQGASSSRKPLRGLSASGGDNPASDRRRRSRAGASKRRDQPDERAQPAAARIADKPELWRRFRSVDELVGRPARIRRRLAITPNLNPHSPRSFFRTPPASPPEPWFKPSRAREKSSPSPWATASCLSKHQPVCSRSNPFLPPI